MEIKLDPAELAHARQGPSKVIRAILVWYNLGNGCKSLEVCIVHVPCLGGRLRPRRVRPVRRSGAERCPRRRARCTRCWGCPPAAPASRSCRCRRGGSPGSEMCDFYAGVTLKGIPCRSHQNPLGVRTYNAGVTLEMIPCGSPEDPPSLCSNSREILRGS